MIGAADDISEGLLTNSVNGILGFGPAITSRTFNTSKLQISNPDSHEFELFSFDRQGDLEDPTGPPLRKRGNRTQYVQCVL